jgi:hypothetical protein
MICWHPLPDELDRATVTEIGARAPDSEVHAVDAFVAAIARGYDPSGTAPFEPLGCCERTGNRRPSFAGQRRSHVMTGERQCLAG